MTTIVMTMVGMHACQCLPDLDYLLLMSAMGPGEVPSQLWVPRDIHFKAEPAALCVRYVSLTGHPLQNVCRYQPDPLASTYLA